jgi:hypothetical protein
MPRYHWKCPVPHCPHKLTHANAEACYAVAGEHYAMEHPDYDFYTLIKSTKFTKSPVHSATSLAEVRAHRRLSK